jgi:hypothetical protein
MTPFRSGRILASIAIAGVVALGQTADVRAISKPPRAHTAIYEEKAIKLAKAYQEKRCGDTGRKCIKSEGIGPYCNRQPRGKGHGQWGCYGWVTEADKRGAWSCEVWSAWSQWGNLIPGSGHKSCYPPLQNRRRR